jgi:2-C-methyl-D-erythritol 2,4-cyclodiphosphate synthase
MFRIGFGSDTHRLASGDGLWLGGKFIKCELKAVGHSDADCLLHAITDAVLGAAGLGDIGTHFPDSDEAFRGRESRFFLRKAVEMAGSAGWLISNIDCVIHLEKPKLRPYISEIVLNIAEIVSIPADSVNIKAKTGEGIGPIGNSEIIKAEAVCLLQKR